MTLRKLFEIIYILWKSKVVPSKVKGGQYSDEACQALQRLLDIFLPSHRAIKRKNSSTTYPASVLQISIHTFKESLSVSLFRSQHIAGTDAFHVFPEEVSNVEHLSFWVYHNDDSIL